MHYIVVFTVLGPAIVQSVRFGAVHVFSSDVIIDTL